MKLSDINYYPVKDIQQDIIDGRLGYCEPQFYIRQSIDDVSVAKKKEGLTFHEPTNDANVFNSVIRVIEPLIFYLDGNGEKRVLSGNTRIRAIMEMLNEAKYSSYIFEDVPYREVVGEITEDDFIHIQHSTNDYTESHSVLDLALAVQKLKQKTEDRLIVAGETNKKKIAAAGTLKVCEVFKIKEGYRSQLQAIAEAPDFVHELMRNNKISGDAVVRIKREAGKSVTPEALKRIYDTLGAMAAQEAKDLGGDLQDFNDEAVKISARHINKYFQAAKEKIQELDNKAGGGSTPTSGSSSTPATGGGLDSKSPTVSNVEMVRVDEKTFADNVKHVVRKLYSIQQPDIRVDNAKSTTNLVKKMISTINSLNEYFPTETNIEVFDQIQNLFNVYFGNVDHLVETIVKSNPEADFTEINNRINKIKDPMDLLWTEVYEPKVKEVKESKKTKTQEVEPTQQDKVTTFESGDFEAQVNVPVGAV